MPADRALPRAALSLLTIGLGACGDPSVCVVAQGGAGGRPALRSEGLERAAARAWEGAGPFFTFSTAPDDACSANPVTPESSEVPGVQLYVTYPTVDDPLESLQAQVAAGRWPVVVFSHANNDSVCSIFQRYRSLHDHWASWGFVVVGVDDTELNCAPGTRQNIEGRAARQRAALQALASWSSDPSSRFFERLDLARVVLAGHSRGGGAALVNVGTSTVIRGVIDLQGVDTTAFGFGSPDIDVPVLGVSVSEDVDLNYPGVEYTEEQLVAPYTWVTIHGGIHAWTADTVPEEPDDEPLIAQDEQHHVTQLFSTAFLAKVVGLGSDLDPVDVSAAAVATHLYGFVGARRAGDLARGASVRWNRFEPDAVVVDDFEGSRSGAPAPDINLLGGRAHVQGGLRAEEIPTYAEDPGSPSAIDAKAWSLSLSGGPGSYVTEVDLPPGTGRRLMARVKGPDEGSPPSSWRVAFHGPERGRAYEGRDHIGPHALTNRFTQLVVPVPDAIVETIRIEIDDGALFVDDLRVVPASP